MTVLYCKSYWAALRQTWVGERVATSQNITLNENNDEDVSVSITTNIPAQGTTLNITGMTVEAYLKLSAATADTDASTWKGSTATSGVVMTDAFNGLVTVSIPASSVLLSMKWWRVDVISGGKRKTAVYGTVSVNDL